MCVCVRGRESESERPTLMLLLADRIWLLTERVGEQAAKRVVGAVKRKKRIGNRGRVCQGKHCIHRRRRLTRSTN